MRALVLHVRSFAFTADDGRDVSGSTMTYLDLDTPPAGTLGASPGSSAQDDERGVAPLTITVPDRLRPNLKAVPGVYDVTYHHKRGRGGRVQLALGHAELLTPVDLSEL